MALFEGVEAGAVEREDRSGWPVGERLKHRIIDGERDGLEADLEEQLQSMPALGIVNDVLLDGMKVVGELFGSGQMQLPFVLQSAETMKAAVAYLEPHMEKSDAGGKGKVVLATVKGDVHDIGKNLVDIILTNNGYMVYNLGIKVAINDMIEKALEVEADAIGMSGLLVKSTLIMRENLEELNSRGLADRVPVLLGGAALTRTYVERDLRDVYDGRVFYGKDAFEGLRTMDTLVQGARAGTLDPAFGRELGGRNLPPRKSQREAEEVEIPARSDVATDVEVFTPPFLGSQIAKGISLDEIAALRQRDRAVPQPVAVPARIRRGRRRLQDARARRCCASNSTSRSRKASSSRRSRGATSASTPKATISSSGRTTRARRSGCGSISRVSAKRRSTASATSSAPRRRASPTTRRSTSSRWARSPVHARRSSSRPTSTRTTCSCTASRSR